jgi:predicted acylesterase/phospholipase RssA
MDDKGNIPLPPSIYFGGCCFGAAFYVGVYKAMVELWGEDFYKKINISGGSAGTIFAVGIALGKSPEALDSLYRKVAENTNKYGPVYYASRFMTEGLRDLLDDPKAHRILEGRCMIGTTSCFATHRWSVSS